MIETPSGGPSFFVYGTGRTQGRRGGVRLLTRPAEPRFEVVVMVLNWDAIRKEYETTGTTLRELAERYGVSLGTVKSRCSREKWAKQPATKVASATAIEVAERVASKGRSRDADEVNWDEIELEYITAPVASFRRLAKERGVSETTLTRRAIEGQWAEKRHQHWSEVIAEARALLKDRAVLANARHFEAAERARAKLEQAIAELETYIVKRRKRTSTKTVEVDEAGKRTGAFTLTEHEDEKIETDQGPVDRKALRDLAAALRDLQAVQRLALGLSTERVEGQVTQRHEYDCTITLKDLMESRRTGRPVAELLGARVQPGRIELDPG